jgi:hypothetical protein
MGETYHEIFAALFGLREGQANHALMERQAKWSLSGKIKIRKRIDEESGDNFTVVTEKSRP